MRPLARAPGRRGYLDWLRGIAVLIMIEGHTLDAWTLASERGRTGYGLAIIIAGIGAPVFLLLAGIGLVLAGGARLRRGATTAQAAAALRRRAWQIFGLAFLFRLQSWILSGGAPLDTLLKVDILNIMGLAMVAAAVLWGLTDRPELRVPLLVAAAVAMSMLTPIVRTTTVLDALPDPIEWYLRPSPGRTTFTLFPWAGFLFAGAALGAWLDRPSDRSFTGGRHERRAILALAVAGPVLGLAGYGASYLPPLYAQASYWTSSPTYFFVRLGILLSMLPLAYAWERRPWRLFRREWLQEYGRASLFIYWIHVEMVYGAMSSPLHRRLTFEHALMAFAALSVVLFGIAKGKDTLVAWWRNRLSGPRGPCRRLRMPRGMSSSPPAPG